MGRHRAADGAAVHPLVADALARRAARALDPEQEPGEGGLGWPAPPKRGGGLGWPGDLDHAPDDVTTTEDATTEDVTTTGAAAPAAERRGVWRRLFGARPAA